MRPGRAADHLHPSSAAVMEEYSYTSSHPLGHTGPVTGPLYLFLFRPYWLELELSLPCVVCDSYCVQLGPVLCILVVPHGLCYLTFWSRNYFLKFSTSCI